MSSSKTYSAILKGITDRKFPWITRQITTQYENYMAALPVTLRRRYIEMGFMCLWGRSSSIPGNALELWSSACTTSGLGRSLGAWVSALSLSRLIPGQSSEAAAWAMISWKPIKCSWAYFGSGMERETLIPRTAGHHAGITTRGPRVPNLALGRVPAPRHHYYSWYSLRSQGKWGGKLCLDTH